MECVFLTWEVGGRGGRWHGDGNILSAAAATAAATEHTHTHTQMCVCAFAHTHTYSYCGDSQRTDELILGQIWEVRGQEQMSVRRELVKSS